MIKSVLGCACLNTQSKLGPVDNFSHAAGRHVLLPCRIMSAPTKLHLLYLLVAPKVIHWCRFIVYIHDTHCNTWTVNIHPSCNLEGNKFHWSHSFSHWTNSEISNVQWPGRDRTGRSQSSPLLGSDAGGLRGLHQLRLSMAKGYPIWPQNG